ncbi:right-handed parallel beta-helix repeat-containing protein [Cerasicoccus maritimus]|uniref:right-handed parallel beta-helix repeat-containing protein n=1 Tax=Cerasicoccus maritimus TaxID=490089 RepID=UPI002852C03E|nr:right-handed parallel beta-helix repeat-containing protein [Cerasicoccus maritimus]
MHSSRLPHLGRTAFTRIPPIVSLTSLAFAGFLSATTASADTSITLTANASDNNISINGSAGDWYLYPTCRIGRRSNNGYSYDYVIPFQLPDLHDDIVKSAELTIDFAGGSYGAAGLGNLDLYGIQLYSTSSGVSNASYYAGADNPLNPDAMLLQDDFVVTADLVSAGYGPVTSVDIGDFVQSMYDGGAQPGDYIFLTVSIDAIPGSDYRYLTANTANGSLKPTLDLVVGPDLISEGVIANGDDGLLNANGYQPYNGGGDERLGRFNTDGNLYCFIMPFQLPALVPGTLTEATLSVNFESGSYNAANLGDVDLYGIETISNSSDTAKAEYYVYGPAPTNPDAVLLQDNLADTSDLVANGYGSVTSVDIKSFIEARYAEGAQPGDIVFLVLTLDAYPSANYRYLTVSTASASVVENRPTLTITGTPSDVPTTRYLDPVNGLASNPGTSALPWPGLKDSLAAGKPIYSGNILKLRDGYHGSVDISGNKTEPTIIMPDDGHSPTNGYIHFNNASNWVIDGLELSHEFEGNITQTDLVDVHSTSHHITIKNCLIYSKADSANWTIADWNAYACKGISFDGDNCTADNNTILNTGFSIVVGGGAEYAVVSRNTIDGFSGDGIRGLADHGLFEYNLIMNAKDLQNGNHDDGFQSWSGATGNDSYVEDIVLRGNVIIGYTEDNNLKSSMQGIGCFDGYFKDWIVENNIVITDMYHGLSLYGAIDCLIINNTVTANPVIGKTYQPWLAVYPHKNGTSSSGTIVRNNLVRSINSVTYGQATVDNNVAVGSNYDDHFVDWANFDLRLKSTSTAINAGSTISAPSHDFEGDARDSLPDIGADEYL